MSKAFRLLPPQAPRNLRDQTFGNFKAITPTVRRDSSRHIIWLTECCDCSEPHYVSSTNLLRGRLPRCEHRDSHSANAHTRSPFRVTKPLNLAVGSCGVVKIVTYTQPKKKQNSNNQVAFYFYRIQIIGSYYDHSSHHHFIVQPMQFMGKFSKRNSEVTPCNGSPEIGSLYSIPARYLYNNFQQELGPIEDAVTAKMLQFVDSNPNRHALVARGRGRALKTVDKLTAMPHDEMSTLRRESAKYYAPPNKTSIKKMFEGTTERVIF